MKLLCTFVFAYLGGMVLGQLPCQPRSFKATAFDIFNYKLSYSYHDVIKGFTLYESVNNENTILYDFNSGNVYIQPRGAPCYRYQDDDAQLNKDPAALMKKAKLDFTYTGPDGVTYAALEVTNGNLTLKNIYTDKCDSVFLSFTINNVMRVAENYAYHEDLPAADAQKIQDVRKVFEDAHCKLRPIN